MRFSFHAASGRRRRMRRQLRWRRRARTTLGSSLTTLGRLLTSSAAGNRQGVSRRSHQVSTGGTITRMLPGGLPEMLTGCSALADCNHEAFFLRIRQWVRALVTSTVF